MTPELAAALRVEIQRALEADGKPFDVGIARRVYTLAIAARDMCIAATASTDEAIKAIADIDGPVESLTTPGALPTSAQAAETFGVRMLRELIAALRPLTGGGLVSSVAAVDRDSLTDLPTWLGALAEARSLGLSDVAAGIEAKLQSFGVLPPDGAPPLAVPATPTAGSPSYDGGMPF